MSKENSIAIPEDGKEILDILESSAADGNIELIFSRRPDAYVSYMKESNDVRVFISKKQKRAVATCAEIIRETYINGEIHKTAYICGLKKDAKYNGFGFGANFFRELCRDDIDFYFCSVMADNDKALKMFSKKRSIISLNRITDYKTYIVNPNVKLKSQKHSYDFCKATENDIPALLSFLNNEGKKKNLFPVIRSFEQFHNLKYDDFYLLKKGDEILAAAALWNQVEYKQYIVKKYRGLMKFARFANPILSALGYIKLPKENEFLEFPMLSFFISKNDNRDYYKIFLSEIRRKINKNYGAFVIGLPKNHFAAEILDGIKSINFETKLYEIKFPPLDERHLPINSQNIYPECGLL